MDVVAHLASLSRLTFTEQEQERLTRELSSVLVYFGAVDKAVVSGGVEPAVREGGKASRRQDSPRESAPDELLRGVPQKKGRLVRAPKVF